MFTLLNSLLTVSSHSRNHRVTILSYFYVFGTGRVHDLLISDDTAKTATTVPKLPIPRVPMRDGLEQWRSGHYAGVLSGTHDANDIYINSLDW